MKILLRAECITVMHSETGEMITRWIQGPPGPTESRTSATVTLSLDLDRLLLVLEGHSHIFESPGISISSKLVFSV